MTKQAELARIRAEIDAAKVQAAATFKRQYGVDMTRENVKRVVIGVVRNADRHAWCCIGGQ